MQRISLFILALVATSSYAAETPKSAPEFKMRWVLAHDPINAFRRAASNFSRLVAKETSGKVEVEIINSRDINNGKTLSPEEVFQKLSKGEIEMSQTYTTYLGTHYDKFWALDLPFLFRSHNHASKVLDGKIGSSIMAGLEPSHMHGLAFTYSGGFRVMPASNREIHKVEDLKGLKVRVSSDSPVATALFKQLGAEPIPVKAEVAAKDQSLDASETTYVRFWDLENKQDSHVVNDTGHSLFLTSIVINKEFFEKLPLAYQKAIEKSAKTAAFMERQDSISDGLKVKAQLAKSGYKVVTMSKKERSRMEKLSKPVYGQFEEMFGKDMIKGIQSIY